MPDKNSIFDLIGAAASNEIRRTESNNQSSTTAQVGNPTDNQAPPHHNGAHVDPGSASDDADPDCKAQQEEEQFGSNTSELHEFMQKNRMDSMQAQLDIVITQIHDKKAETTGKEIDNDLRKKMASFTVHFMSWWCLFVAAMFTSFLIAHEGKPPVEAIVALLGTSTISIVGLVGFVVSGLFKSRKENGKEKD
ncbi:hypothetical protein ACTHI8_02780 [Klebsiella quasipneumoniae subsp. similipneumoniae]|uniref:hypothetical protein n=1 Tax=Klebsiella pneumoniae complex TaxID=3390273 RepID=UPI0027F6F1D1|nr:hypothetical protein [Klebsiella pneumoniae]